MQQIPNTHQWTVWEAVFSTLSLRQMRGATIELLEWCFLYGPCRGVISKTSLEFS
jgi:hypothetical protein